MLSGSPLFSRYNVSKKDFLSNHGTSLLLLYKNSPIKVISSIYSDYKYLPFLFEMGPRGYFDFSQNRKEYLSWLLAETRKSNFADLKASDFVNNHGFGILKRFNFSPIKVIESLGEESLLESIPSARRSKPLGFWVPYLSLLSISFRFISSLIL